MAWFWLAFPLLLIVYVMAGYPMLLAWMARRRSRPVHKSSAHQPPVSILIAVHNGETFIRAKLESLLASSYPPGCIEIIVASDGSTDSTEAITSEFLPRGVQLLRLPKGGKPMALNAAAERASYGILLFTDVRQIVMPHSVSRLMRCFADPQVGVASGYLVIGDGSAEENNVGAYWRYERWIRGNLSTLDSMLGATGAFYAMRREFFRPMPDDLLLDDMFLPLQAFFQGYRLILEPQAVIYDLPTNVASEFSRKVRTLAGNYQLFRYMPELFLPRNRMLWHFLSYKFGRLLLPWLFLWVFVASCFLPSPWVWMVLIPQMLFYGLMAADSWVPAGSLLKTVSSPARTVGGMLAATACSVSIFFVPADRLWKPSHGRR